MSAENQKSAAPDSGLNEASEQSSETLQPDEQGSAAQSEKAKIDNRARLKEITAVLRRHQVTRGVTPEKLRAILE